MKKSSLKILTSLALSISLLFAMQIVSFSKEIPKWQLAKKTNPLADFKVEVNQAWSTTVTPPEFEVNLTAAAIVYVDENNKLRKINLDGVISPVINTDPDVEQIQFDSEGNLYIVFSSQQYLNETDSYILVKVDSSDNSVAGIDHDLSELVWITNTVSPNIQFDGLGNIYYLARTDEDKIVLRKYVNESDTTDFINENIEVNHWLVRTNGTVLIAGKTISTQTGWLRKISTGGLVEYIATPAEVGWILDFPDGHVYAGLPDSAPYHGVYRLDGDLSYIDEDTDANTPYIGFESEGYVPEYDVDEIANGHDATYSKGFTDAGGVYLLGQVQTDDNTIYGLTGEGNFKTVVQYYPTPEILELQLINRISLLRESLNELVIPGTKNGVNKLILYNLAANTELNILYENIEIYHLDVLSSGTILFDGWDFDKNKYVVGMFERAAGSLNEMSLKAGYGYKELTTLSGQPSSFLVRDVADSSLSISISSPTHGATVSGTVDVATSITAENDITKVEFYINDVLKNTDTAAPYTYSWDTTGYATTYHSIKAIVSDSQSQTAEDEISVYLNNIVTTQYTLTITAGTGGTTDPTPGTHAYDDGTEVEISPTASSGYTFAGWTGDVASVNQDDNPLTITMDSDKSITANFASQTYPYISLSASSFNFGAVSSGVETESQNLRISNTGGGTLAWTVSDDATWLSCTPESGSGSSAVAVAVDSTGLSVGTHTATINVSSTSATNSPQSISVSLQVYASGGDAAPFGSFDTPTDQSTVMSSVPVTGWVVDDIGIESLKVYRDPVSGEGGSLIFIGDAVFVEGARPDVESLYPDYPLNYQAGWGYMLLTNFLPDQGNGTFVLYAVAKDTSGHEVTLGSKTITCDNANAVKPFGAIDTPTQGGTASGDAFVNFGWALTPMPNSIPTDGSTINVFVDGVNLGHPAYNNYRADIATLFPGYANSDGAVGFYTLDTTAYANGVHSIVWSVEDNVGNVDGIGSRYFSIFNGSTADAAKAQGISKRVSINTPMSFEEVISTVPSFDPIAVKKGYREDTAPVSLQPDSYGVSTIAIKEVERLVINLNPSTSYTGYLMVGNRLRALPLGSTLDPRTGIFSWQPGPGFLGEYELVFIRGNSSSNRVKINVRVKIKPKFGLK